jgi:hypothetical protein
LTTRAGGDENLAHSIEEADMAWKLNGTYFENCSCEMPCPCTVSFDAGADYDRCQVLLAFNVESGEVDGVDVGGLTAAVIADTPKVMTEGSWRLGLIVDEAASDEQAEKLGAVFSGELGGPMAALAPLIGDMLGSERMAIEYENDGLHHRVRAGDGIDIEVKDVVPFGVESGEPARLEGVFHPAGSTLTIAKSQRGKISAFGLDFDNSGRSAFSAPFSWAG